MGDPSRARQPAHTPSSLRSSSSGSLLGQCASASSSTLPIQACELAIAVLTTLAPGPSSTGPPSTDFIRLQIAFRDMPTASFIISFIAVLILTGKFGVSASRRWKKRHIIPWHDVKSSAEPFMCLILIVPKVLLLIFSIQQNEKLLRVFLSVAARLLILYQCGVLSIFCFRYPRWLRWLPLGLQILCAIPLTAILCVLIAFNKGHTEAEKITTLSFFLAEHVLLTAIYMDIWGFYRNGNSKSIELLPIFHILQWSLVLGITGSVCAIASLALYRTSQIDFLTSLWIINAAAIIWAALWLVIQCVSIKKSKPNTNTTGSVKNSRIQQGFGDFQKSLFASESSRALVLGSDTVLLALPKDELSLQEPPGNSSKTLSQTPAFSQHMSAVRELHLAQATAMKDTILSSHAPAGKFFDGITVLRQTQQTSQANTRDVDCDGCKEGLRAM